MRDMGCPLMLCMLELCTLRPSASKRARSGTRQTFMYPWALAGHILISFKCKWCT